jgi:tetratricopeptide (TPR) repeat protein
MGSRKRLRASTRREKALDPGATNSPGRKPFLASATQFRFLCACQYTLVTWLFWPSLAYEPSSLDDYSQLKNAGARTFAQLLDYDQFGHFRPVKNLLFWLLSHDVGHIGPWRVAILAVFIGSIAIVQALASRLLGSRFAGLAVAALWSLNPTTATVVCWLSTANLVLCLFGSLVYVCLAARALAQPRMARRERVAIAIALLALLLAALSHELALLAPIALLAHSRALAVGTKPRWTHPVFSGSAMCIACFVALGASSHGTASVYRAQHEPAWQLAGSAARYFATNTLAWFWPRGQFGVLLSDTPSQHVVAAALCWVVLLMAAVAAWTLRRRDRVLALGLAWFALFLVPVSNFVPLGNTPVAPHYLYMPGVGLALALTRALQLLYPYVQRRSARGAFALGVGLMFSIGSAWLPETQHVITAWRNDETLFSATVDNYPDAVEPLINLASFELRAERYAQAKSLLERAQRLAPKDAMVVRNMFSLLWQTEPPQAALGLLDQHPELEDEPEFLIRRGEALERLDDHEAARAAFQRAFDGTDSATHSEERLAAGYRLMVESLRTQDIARAREVAEQLLREYPTRKELEPARELLRDGDSPSDNAPP